MCIPDQIWLRFWITMARLPKNPRTHCYFGCEEGGPLHHFPKPDRDRERFDVWKEVLDEAIKIKGDAYIYNQLRLCNKHFEDYYISPSKCLTRNAVPTLYITGLLSGTTSSSEAAEVCVEPAASVTMLDNMNSNINQTLVGVEDISIHETEPSTSKDIMNQIDVQPSTSRTNPLRKRKPRTGGVLHVFPNPNKFPEQFKAWVRVVCGQDECNFNYRIMRICDRHFTENDRNRFRAVL